MVTMMNNNKKKNKKRNKKNKKRTRPGDGHPEHQEHHSSSGSSGKKRQRHECQQATIAAAAAAASQEHCTALFRDELKDLACTQLIAAIDTAFPHFKGRMTTIQRLTIPAVLRDRHRMEHDVMSRAATGSGKTLAFLVPCVDFLCRRLLAQAEGKGAGRRAGGGTGQAVRTVGAMVLCPTRELAMQTANVARQLLDGVERVDGRLRLRAVVTIGGRDKDKEARDLANGCDLLIATPGRVLDHMNDKSLVVPMEDDDNDADRSFRYLVLDEADQLLDTGFEHTVRKIIGQLPRLRSTMLFSATLTKKVKALMRVSLRMDKLISVGEQLDASASTLEHRYVIVPADARIAALMAILRAHRQSKVVVFVALKSAVTLVAGILEGAGFKNVRSLRGGGSQNKRTRVFTEFMEDRSPCILVATDVAARGLDFPDVELVVQCDLPQEWSQYFHRAGRTARAGRKGVALLMLTAQEHSSCLSHLQGELSKGSGTGGEPAADDESSRITEIELPASDKELASLQKTVESIVAKTEMLLEYAKGMPKQYKKVLQMSARKIGLKADEFDAEAVHKSLGIPFSKEEEEKKTKTKTEKKQDEAGQAKPPTGQHQGTAERK